MNQKRVVLLICLIVTNQCASENENVLKSLSKINEKSNTFNSQNPYQNEEKECIQKSGQRGKCVQSHFCSQQNIINEKIECNHSSEVCCNSSEVTSIPIARNNNKKVNNTVKGCGQRYPEGIGFKITGDNESVAAFGEFPWMVAILREEQVIPNTIKLNVFVCGGSLIHPKAVLTAANCLEAKFGYKLKVRAGEWDTQTKTEILPYQERNVTKIVSHPTYNNDLFYNDIAILILESPFNEADNIGVICLPPANLSPPSSRCCVSGWGKDGLGKEGKYQVILKKVNLPIVEKSICQSNLRETRLGNQFELHDSFICAGGEDEKSACKGDEGSPLICPIQENSNKYVQSGIVSWGIDCGRNNKPGVYVNVAFFKDWIDQHLTLNNIDMTSYDV